MHKYISNTARETLINWFVSKCMGVLMHYCALWIFIGVAMESLGNDSDVINCSTRLTYGFWQGEMWKSQRKGLICWSLWKTGDLPLHLLQTRWRMFVRDSLHRTQLKTLIRHFVCFKNGRNREIVISALQNSCNVLLLKSLTTGFPVLLLNAGE